MHHVGGTRIDPGLHTVAQANPFERSRLVAATAHAQKLGSVAGQAMRRLGSREKSDAFSKFIVVGIACQQRMMIIHIFGNNILLHLIPVDAEHPLCIIGCGDASWPLPRVFQAQGDDLHRCVGCDKEAHFLL
mgnify:CR=1 FL=1